MTNFIARFMLDASEVTAVMLPRYKASYGAGRAWDVTFHRLNSTGGAARRQENVPELIVDARLASNSSVNAKWTVSTSPPGARRPAGGDQDGAAWNLRYDGHEVRLLRARRQAGRRHSRSVAHAQRARFDPSRLFGDEERTVNTWRRHLDGTTPVARHDLGPTTQVEPWKPHTLTDLQCAMRSSVEVNATFGLRGTIGLALGDHAFVGQPTSRQRRRPSEFCLCSTRGGQHSTVRVSVDILQPAPPDGNDARRRWRVTFTPFADAGDGVLTNVAGVARRHASSCQCHGGRQGAVRTGGPHFNGKGPAKTFTATYLTESVTLSTNLTEDQYKVAFQDAFTSLSPLHQSVNALGTTKARNPAYWMCSDKTRYMCCSRRATPPS